MTNLILVHPNDRLNVTKTILTIDNWRVIGRMPNKKFYLITHDCKVYHIKDFTLKKFNSLIHMGLEMTRKGIFDTVALVCPDCGGSGVTDWITDVVGTKIPLGPFEPSFTRDPAVPVLKTKLNSDGQQFVVYFSRALVPEAQQHCKECKGTGLFILGHITEDMGEEFSEYKFR